MVAFFTRGLTRWFGKTPREKPTKDELIKASSLFELYLKTQDQINIYTIHSFVRKF